MSDSNTQPDYIKRIAGKFYVTFEDVRNSDKFHIKGEQKNIPICCEDAVITALLKILGLKKATIIRPTARWETTANKPEHIKLKFDITHSS